VVNLAVLERILEIGYRERIVGLNSIQQSMLLHEVDDMTKGGMEVSRLLREDLL
jgi:hypothetical protein